MMMKKMKKTDIDMKEWVTIKTPKIVKFGAAQIINLRRRKQRFASHQIPLYVKKRPNFKMSKFIEIHGANEKNS